MLAANAHATQPGRLQIRSRGLKLGQKYEVKVAACGCGPFRITVKCSRSAISSSVCAKSGVCQCDNSLMVFSRPDICTHVVDGAAPPQQPPSPPAAKAAAAEAEAVAAPDDAEDVGPPPWWGADFDAKFAEVLRVTKTSPAYIDDRLLEQIVVKTTFPDVTIAQWLLAKGFIDESAMSGSINAAYRAQKNKPFQHLVLDGATRTKRKRSVGPGIWHDDDGAKLYHDGRGGVARGPRPSR